MQKSPLLEEQPLRIESLEEKRLLSGTALSSVQQDTAFMANMVLRAEPVELLKGTKEFDGSAAGVVSVPDSPVFTDGSFTIEVSVRPDAIRAQTLVSKYNSQSEPGQSFFLAMLADGRLRFSVYGEGGACRILETDGVPLTAGAWQKVRASFDIQSQRMSLTVDGKEVPSAIVEGSTEVRALYDSTSPVRLGGVIFGGGPNWIFKGGMEEGAFYPVASFDAKTEAAATDAALAEDAAEEPSAEGVATERQTAAAAIDAVLRAEPVTLLAGTREFDGSAASVVSVPDSPIFTDGSFTIDISVRPASIREQAIVSKYNTQQADPDNGFLLMMLGNGRLRFIVYGEGGTCRILESTEPALAAGVWQRVQASFDIQSQRMTLAVEGRELPAAVQEGSQEITRIHDGTSDVRLGGVVYGSGLTRVFGGDMREGTFYPVAQYGIPKEAQEAETPPPTDTGTEPNPEGLLQIKQAVTEVLQEMLAAQEGTEAEQPRTLTDAIDLSATRLQDGRRVADLRNVGGTVSFLSWQGRSVPGAVDPVTGEDVRRAAIAANLAPEAIQATPLFSTVMGFANGIQRDPATNDTRTVTKTIAGMGRVSLSVDNNKDQRNLTVENGLIGGQQVNAKFGHTDMSLSFLDGPQYVQWLDLKILEGPPGVRIWVGHSDGSGYEIPVAGSGPVVIDDTVAVLGFLPAGDASGIALRSINMTQPSASADSSVTWLQNRGELTGIDLSGAERAIDTIDLGVLSDRPQGTVEVVGYRGSQRVASQTVASGGTAHLEDAGGFTSVLFIKSDPSATLYATSMTVSGMSDSAPPPSTGLTALENPDVAYYGNRRQWEHGDFNWAQVQANNGVLRQQGGYANYVNGSVLFGSIGVSDQKTYTRLDLTTTSGSVSFGQLFYTDADGLHPVPASCWKAVSGNVIIVYPGAPHYLVAQINGQGTFTVGGTTGALATDIMPSETMVPRCDPMIVRKVGPAEGWCVLPTGVSTNNAHARAGGTVNILWSVMNLGLGGGPVTVRVHVGQTGTAADPVQKEFTGDLPGLATKALSVNVTLGADNDVCTLEIIGPDGQSVIGTQQVHPPRSSNGTSLLGTQIEEHLARAGRLVADALRGSHPTARLVVAAQGQMNVQRERQEQLANGTTQTIITVTEEEIKEEAEKVLVAMLDTNTETEIVAQANVENLIKERVAARLNERLQSMTMEERATARGLLRLKEDGKLDEYFASLFSGKTSDAVSSELDGAGGYSVYYLLDKDALIGAGHAAMIMGSETEGWYYFSFGYGSTVLTANGNMDAEYFVTLKEAQKALDRYDGYLRWNVKNSSSIRSAFREASSHLTDDYSLFSQNCDDIAAKIIRASGVQLQDEWKPTNTLNYYWGEADEIGNWKLFVQ